MYKYAQTNKMVNSKTYNKKPLKYPLHAKRLMDLERIAWDHLKKNALYIEIWANKYF